MSSRETKEKDAFIKWAEENLDSATNLHELREAFEAGRREIYTECELHTSHPSWKEKSKEEILEAFRFQGAITKAFMEDQTKSWLKIIELETALGRRG